MSGDFRIAAQSVSALEYRRGASCIAALESHPAEAVDHCRVVRRDRERLANQLFGVDSRMP